MSEEVKFECECVCGCRKPYWNDRNIHQCTRCLIDRLHGCEEKHGYVRPPKTSQTVWMARDINSPVAGFGRLFLYVNKPTWMEDLFVGKSVEISSTKFPEIKNGQCVEAEIVLLTSEEK